MMQLLNSDREKRGEGQPNPSQEVEGHAVGHRECVSDCTGKRDLGTDRTWDHCGRKGQCQLSGLLCLLGRWHVMMNVTHVPRNDGVILCILSAQSWEFLLF